MTTLQSKSINLANCCLVRPRKPAQPRSAGFLLPMPSAAPRPCKRPGCRKLTTAGAYCPDHAAAIRKQADAQRGSSTQRGYGYKWQQASKKFLRDHPLCQCESCKEGTLRLWPSSVVDHKTPPKLKEALDSKDPNRIARAQKLFWDQNNWQALNKQCHDRKTATEDGGFGGFR